MQIYGSLMIYADDTCTIVSDNTWNLVYKKTNAELNRLVQKLNKKKKIDL